ncbi:MAG TPA: choice-of-anchor Q domain-containing protein [Pyrinomonadaceae bacterium]|nr:choice-of-anchor Q domain-containing protein [Pyrinomonadaceae bacterium]
MKIRVASLLTLVVLIGAFLSHTQSVSSNSSNQPVGAVLETSNLFLPLTTTFTVDRTDDTAAATACTPADNDCSLRGAIIAANADVSADPVIINLEPATTYNLTLTNATQENAAATGDLDITTSLHSVTIVGGGSSGPNATIIDAAGLTSGNMRDRVFQVTGSGVTFVLQDLAIQNGQAADDGASGASTNPAAQNSTRAGGGILNGAGIDVNGITVNGGGSITLTNVVVGMCQVLGKGDSIINQHTTLDAWGGGLASLGATGIVIVTNSTFTGNTAAGGDGGNFNNGAGSNARGGSIYSEGGTLNIDGSRIDNSAANGGNGGNQDQNGQTNASFGGTAQGGGVWVGSGTATINNTTFENTTANGGDSGTGGNGSEPAGPADGGGLYSLGTATVTNSTFHLAGATGGRSGDTFGSTCLGGHTSLEGGGARGGAIFADGGSLIINTATFANNFAIGGDGGNGGQTNGGLNCGAHGKGGFAYGGAIANNNAAAVNIKHGTISGNNAQAGNTGVNQGGANKPPQLVAEGAGGGIRVGPASVTLENTIIAGNTAANGLGDTTGAPTPGPNVDGTITSNGHNLLGVATEATGFTGIGDLTGTNPMLAALADNSGPTQTMALSPGSPAIDAGVAAGDSFDQRGRPRTFDDPGVVNAATSDGTDIGAFELQPLCSLTCPGDISVPNDTGLCEAIVDYAEPSGAGCGRVTCDHPSGSLFPVGETTVICTSSVGPTCSFKVTVSDTEAPTITLNGDVITLWPPDHKYDTVQVSDLVASASDKCDAGVGLSSVFISQVTSDEVENGNGDGNTLKDIVIAPDCKSVQLRSERSGSGNGRVYTITFKVVDAAGNVATATAKVTVAKSQNGSAAVDDGPHYTVVGGCN